MCFSQQGRGDGEQTLRQKTNSSRRVFCSRQGRGDGEQTLKQKTNSSHEFQCPQGRGDGGRGPILVVYFAVDRGVVMEAEDLF